jgi:hypothetical protein
MGKYSGLNYSEEEINDLIQIERELKQEEDDEDDYDNDYILSSDNL